MFLFLELDVLMFVFKNFLHMWLHQSKYTNAVVIKVSSYVTNPNPLHAFMLEQKFHDLWKIIPSIFGNPSGNTNLFWNTNTCHVARATHAYSL